MKTTYYTAHEIEKIPRNLNYGMVAFVEEFKPKLLECFKLIVPEESFCVVNVNLVIKRKHVLVL